MFWKLLKQCLCTFFSRYKHAFNQLKALKTEIEHMQFLLEKSKVKLQKDFELWWAEQVTHQNEGVDTKVVGVCVL